MAFSYQIYLMTLKIKDKKLFGRTCLLDNFISRENLNYRGLFVYKGSGSGIFPDPDPDPQHCIIHKNNIHLLLSFSIYGLEITYKNSFGHYISLVEGAEANSFIRKKRH